MWRSDDDERCVEAERSVAAPPHVGLRQADGAARSEGLGLRWLVDHFLCLRELRDQRLPDVLLSVKVNVRCT